MIVFCHVDRFAQHVASTRMWSYFFQSLDCTPQFTFWACHILLPVFDRIYTPTPALSFCSFSSLLLSPPIANLQDTFRQFFPLSCSRLRELVSQRDAVEANATIISMTLFRFNRLVSNCAGTKEQSRGSGE